MIGFFKNHQPFVESITSVSYMAPNDFPLLKISSVRKASEQGNEDHKECHVNQGFHALAGRVKEGKT